MAKRARSTVVLRTPDAGEPSSVVFSIDERVEDGLPQVGGRRQPGRRLERAAEHLEPGVRVDAPRRRRRDGRLVIGRQARRVREQVSHRCARRRWARPDRAEPSSTATSTAYAISGFVTLASGRRCSAVPRLARMPPRSTTATARSRPGHASIAVSASATSIESGEELEHRGVGLVGTLLLRPVTAPLEHDGAPKVRHERRQRLHCTRVHRDHPVAVARDEQGGRCDRPRRPTPAVSSHVRSMLRYQFSPPRKPTRSNSPT